jgi:hypothetical protein
LVVVVVVGTVVVVVVVGTVVVVDLVVVLVVVTVVPASQVSVLWLAHQAQAAAHSVLNNSGSRTFN